MPRSNEAMLGTMIGEQTDSKDLRTLYLPVGNGETRMDGSANVEHFKHKDLDCVLEFAWCAWY